jgi:hypothetical protein
VVKSLRNWARAQARTAEKRGRFEGSKEVGVAVADDVVLVASATVITSSIHQYHSLSLSPSLCEMGWSWPTRTGIWVGMRLSVV